MIYYKQKKTKRSGQGQCRAERTTHPRASAIVGAMPHTMKGRYTMTIREYILKGATKASKDRLEKLIELGAPEIVIENQKKYTEQLENEEIKISGDIEVLTEEVETVQPWKGRGGKCYYIINRNINFFPNAKYGPYIKKV